MEWRTVGDPSEAVVRAELGRRDSPMLPEAAAIAASLAGLGFGRLVLAILANEQQYGVDTRVIPAEYHNPMSLKADVREGDRAREGKDGWARFPTYAAGIAAGIARLRDPRGPYAATVSLLDLARVYAPDSDGNDAAAVARFWERYIARYVGMEPTAALNWTPVSYPPLVDLVVPKPYEGAGFDRVPFRGDRIIGVCDHITAGEGSIEFYAAFFGTGGERATDALVDTVIGRDGRIGLLNDWRDPRRGGTRAGWANGGSDGLEGRGIAFVQTLGSGAVNERLVSKEHVAREGQPPTDAQLAASIALDVAILQERRVPWHEYPFCQAYGGLAVDYDHADFATKRCPAEPWRSTYGPIKEREVRAGLARAQTGQSAPPPGADPPAPGEVLAALFGTLARQMPDGATRHYPFDPTGPISSAWLARCRRELMFPAAERWWTAGERQFVRFANGWVLAAPAAHDRAGWRWLDPAMVAALTGAPVAGGDPSPAEDLALVAGETVGGMRERPAARTG